MPFSASLKYAVLKYRVTIASDISCGEQRLHYYTSIAVDLSGRSCNGRWVDSPMLSSKNLVTQYMVAIICQRII